MASKSKGRLNDPINIGNVKTRFWSPEIMTAAKIFGKDIARLDAGDVTNSIFEPVIYQLYLNDVTKSPVKTATES